MIFRRSAQAMSLGTCLMLPGLALAASAPGGSVVPAFSAPIANIPGKTITAVVVDYVPGGKTPTHRHPGSAFIVAYVLSGAIRSQVEGGEAKVYRAGESWTELPGAHHIVSENASATEPARMLATFVLDTNDSKLVTLDGQ